VTRLKYLSGKNSKWKTCNEGPKAQEERCQSGNDRKTTVTNMKLRRTCNSFAVNPQNGLESSNFTTKPE
jgi:hypothetical protein